jgi:hypothetical protein
LHDHRGCRERNRAKKPLARNVLDTGRRIAPIRKQETTENCMSLSMILLIVLILILLGALPAWPHSKSWGYGPSGALGVVLLIVIVLIVMKII